MREHAHLIGQIHIADAHRLFPFLGRDVDRVAGNLRVVQHVVDDKGNRCKNQYFLQHGLPSVVYPREAYLWRK